MNQITEAQHLQYEGDIEVIFAARSAAYHSAKPTARDWEGRSRAMAAEHRLTIGEGTGRPLRAFRERLEKAHGTANLCLLRQRTPSDLIVREALRATYERHGVTARDIQGRERLLAAEAELTRVKRGPLARHARALRRRFGTADLLAADGIARRRLYGSA